MSKAPTYQDLIDQSREDQRALDAIRRQLDQAVMRAQLVEPRQRTKPITLPRDMNDDYHRQFGMARPAPAEPVGALISREDAKAAGLVRFFTGRSCKRGHISERSTINRTCLECMRTSRHDGRGKTYADANYERNGEKIRTRHRIDSAARRFEANPVQCAAIRLTKGKKAQARVAGSTTYFTGMPCVYGHISERFVSNGLCCECQRIWRIDHPGIMRNLKAARRARKAGAEGSHTPKQIENLADKQRYRCANPICRALIRNAYHEDHIVALSKGGNDDIHNIQLLCAPCNMRKSNKDPIHWAQSNGLLL